MEKHKIKSLVTVLAGVILLTVLDQASKLWAVMTLNPAKGGSDIILWDGVFRLHYLENRGAAFGLLDGRKPLLILSAILVFLLVFWLYTRLPRDKKFRYLRIIGITIMAGALGNFIDRIRLDYVVDFFYFELINFPVFNIADIYVTGSAAAFVLLFLFYYKEDDFDGIHWIPKKEKA